MTTLYQPSGVCPHCGAPNTAVSEMHGRASKPEPGHFSICLYCGVITVFDSDLSLRAPTEAELDEAMKSPILSFAQAMIKQRHN